MLFPGLGGAIVTQEGVAAALRIEYNQALMVGHKMSFDTSSPRS
jgi:hypothetical protein